ncbi:MAG: serine hydrolase [Anaerolineae bacterium]|nr:serine hydrolase [Anaerolineae bacterium]
MPYVPDDWTASFARVHACFHNKRHTCIGYATRTVYMRFSKKSLVHVFLLSLAALLMLILGLLQPDSALSQGQPTPRLDVTVEAIGSANLRAGPGIEYDLVGTIQSGTSYRMVGRSAHFPWYLIALPESMGWVFKDLVKVNGDLANVPFTEMIIEDLPPGNPTATEFQGLIPPSITPQATDSPVAQITYVIVTNTPVPGAATATPVINFQPSQTSAAANTGVSVKVNRTINVRYGPDVSYPLMGTISDGPSYVVTRRHLPSKWLEIVYPGVPWQRGWVSGDLVTVIGDVNLVPVITGTEFGFPTATPLPPMVVTAAAPWTTPSASINQVLTDLGSDINNYLISRGFVAGTSRQASVFIMNLTTGQAFSINPNVAYTAASLLKVPLMVAMYEKLDTIPDRDLAWLIASMIVCSENTSANRILQFIGDGDALRGAAVVTDTMRQLGLSHTLMSRQFSTDNPQATYTPFPPAFVPPVTTGIDQIITQPDPEKQTTPADMGFLMAAIYQCGLDNSGPLISTFGGKITQAECRQMVYVMKQVVGRAMIPDGLPTTDINVFVAHKRGIIDEMHGDASIVFTPGGDYVLVIMMRQPTYLNPTVSFPIMAEISRRTYNVFNESRPLAEIANTKIPACSRIPIAFVDTLSSANPPPLN